MYNGGGEIKVGCKAVIGFVGPHGDPLEFLELAEKVLNQVAPLVHFLVDRERLGSTRMLGDHRLGPKLETSNNPGLASGYDGGDGDTQR